MAASYPGGFDTMSDPSSNLSGPPLHSTMHNQINDVIEAIEAELGLNPSGAFASVAVLLAEVPQGYVTKATSTATTSLITGDIDVVTVTFTALANRRYRLSLLISFQAAGSASTAFGKITDNTPTQLQAAVVTVPASGFGSLYCFEEVTPAAGSVTYRARISATASVALTGAANQKHYLLVEDIGPV